MSTIDEASYMTPVYEVRGPGIPHNEIVQVCRQQKTALQNYDTETILILKQTWNNDLLDQTPISVAIQLLSATIWDNLSVSNNQAFNYLKCFVCQIIFAHSQWRSCQ